MAKYTSQFYNLLYDLYLYTTHKPLCKFLDFFLQNNFCLGTPLAQTLMMSPPVIPQDLTSQVANITGCETN